MDSSTESKTYVFLPFLFNIFRFLFRWITQNRQRLWFTTEEAMPQYKTKVLVFFFLFSKGNIEPFFFHLLQNKEDKGFVFCSLISRVCFWKLPNFLCVIFLCYLPFYVLRFFFGRPPGVVMFCFRNQLTLFIVFFSPWLQCSNFQTTLCFAQKGKTNENFWVLTTGS